MREEKFLKLLLLLATVISLSTGILYLIRTYTNAFDPLWSLVFAAPYFAASMFLVSWWRER